MLSIQLHFRPLTIVIVSLSGVYEYTILQPQQLVNAFSLLQSIGITHSTCKKNYRYLSYHNNNIIIISRAKPKALDNVIDSIANLMFHNLCLTVCFMLLSGKPADFSISLLWFFPSAFN